MFRFGPDERTLAQDTLQANSEGAQGDAEGQIAPNVDAGHLERGRGEVGDRQRGWYTRNNSRQSKAA